MARAKAPPAPIPRRPYRSSAIFHLILAALIPIVAVATGGGLARALLFAAGFFVLATAWSWWRWHQRLTQEARAAAGSPEGPAR